MTVTKLIQKLKSIEDKGNGDCEIFIAVSEYDDESVLKYIPDDSNPDEAIEINL